MCDNPRILIKNDFDTYTKKSFSSSFICCCQTCNQHCFLQLESRVGNSAQRLKLFSPACLCIKWRTWQENKRIFSLLCNPGSPTASTDPFAVWPCSLLPKHPGQMHVKTGASQKQLPSKMQKTSPALCFNTHPMFLKDLIKLRKLCCSL